MPGHLAFRHVAISDPARSVGLCIDSLYLSALETVSLFFFGGQSKVQITVIIHGYLSTSMWNTAIHSPITSSAMMYSHEQPLLRKK